jgi:hypothetical protein
MVREKGIDYDNYLQKALRQVIRNVLQNTAIQGLPDPHHFYITFATNHPWVRMPDYLRKEYPEEMTIVLQYDFEDLEVEHDHFSVTLRFDDIGEQITVPFLAILRFVDPSVRFGLQFFPSSSPMPDSFVPQEESQEEFQDEKIQNEAPEPVRTNIVSLEDFRKK